MVNILGSVGHSGSVAAAHLRAVGQKEVAGCVVTFFTDKKGPDRLGPYAFVCRALSESESTRGKALLALYCKTDSRTFWKLIYSL